MSGAAAGAFPGCPPAKAGLHPRRVRSLSPGHIKTQTTFHDQYRASSWTRVLAFGLREEAEQPERALHRNGPGPCDGTGTMLL